MYTSAKEGAIYNIATGYGNTNIVGIGGAKCSGIDSSIDDIKCTGVIFDIITSKFTEGDLCLGINGGVSNNRKAGRKIVIVIVRCEAIEMLRSSFRLCYAMRAFEAKYFIFNSSSSFNSSILKHLIKANKLPLMGPLIRHTKMLLLIR